MKCFFKHKWEYGETIDDTYKLIRKLFLSYYPNLAFPELKTQKSRICYKCNKKQILKNNHWHTTQLTKKEIRDINITKLGI